MREAIFQQKRRHLAHAILRNECFARLLDDPNLVRSQDDKTTKVTSCVEASLLSREQDNQRFGLMLWVSDQGKMSEIHAEVSDWLSALESCEIFEATNNWPSQDEILAWVSSASVAAKKIIANRSDRSAWQSFWEHAINLSDLVDEAAQNHKRRSHLLKIKW